jgi:hypothetical protein
MTEDGSNHLQPQVLDTYSMGTNTYRILKQRLYKLPWIEQKKLIKDALPGWKNVALITVTKNFQAVPLISLCSTCQREKV